MKGKIKAYLYDKGFGFIVSSEAPNDIFFHIEDVIGSEVRVGDWVNFDLEENDRGLRAYNVVIQSSKYHDVI